MARIFRDAQPCPPVNDLKYMCMVQIRTVIRLRFSTRLEDGARTVCFERVEE